MKIELLHFEGCPSYPLARERLESAIAENGLTQQIEVIDVRTAEDAVRLRFLGSPTIRIDGLDVEKKARSRTDYGIMCRVYSTESGLDGSPSMKMIRDAIAEALDAQATRR